MAPTITSLTKYQCLPHDQGRPHTRWYPNTELGFIRYNLHGTFVDFFSQHTLTWVQEEEAEKLMVYVERPRVT
jgi:hypothetical protein